MLITIAPLGNKTYEWTLPTLPTPAQRALWQRFVDRTLGRFNFFTADSRVFADVATAMKRFPLCRRRVRGPRAPVNLKFVHLT